MKPKYRAEFHQELSSFSRYIRSLIKRARWTQTEFAKHMGINISTLHRWLTQQTLPSLRLRKKMKLLDEALHRQMSKEDKERVEQQEREREERRHRREMAKRERQRQHAAKRALPKPERAPDQMTSRVAIPVVEFEPDDEAASG